MTDTVQCRCGYRGLPCVVIGLWPLGEPDTVFFRYGCSRCRALFSTIQKPLNQLQKSNVRKMAIETVLQGLV